MFGFQVKLVQSNPKSQDFVASNFAAHRVYHKYQTVVHKDPPEKPNLKQYTRFLVESPLQVNGSQSSSHLLVCIFVFLFLGKVSAHKPSV